MSLLQLAPASRPASRSPPDPPAPPAPAAPFFCNASVSRRKLHAEAPTRDKAKARRNDRIRSSFDGGHPIRILRHTAGRLRTRHQKRQVASILPPCGPTPPANDGLELLADSREPPEVRRRT